MNIDEAMEVHQTWRHRLRSVLDGGGLVEALGVERDDACGLGAWLHGEGARFAQLRVYRELLVAHADFHRHAAQIVRRFNHGEVAEASALLDGTEYAACSTRLVVLLRALKVAVSGKPTPG